MFACVKTSVVLAASACVGHVSGSARICQVAVRRVLLTPSSGSPCEDAGFVGVNRNERDEAAAHASLQKGLQTTEFIPC